EDLAKDAALFASRGKATIVGEFKWNAPTDLASYLAEVENNPSISGDLYWSLFGHRDDFGFEQHDDNLTLHFPGDTPDMKARAALLRAHAYRMRGLAIPAPAPPAAPLITNVTRQGNDNLVAWRGAAGADFYIVDRSTGGPKGLWSGIGYMGQPWPTDNDTPWTDRAVPAGPVWYRVNAYNADKVPGPYSPIYRLAPKKPGSVQRSRYQGFQNVSITIKANGKVFLNGKRVTLADEKARLQSLEASSTTQVFIKTDRHAKYTVLLDVMDKLREIGITQIILTQ
ncbi:MAG: biopolymer transporter ExbD, partial [Armatimonadota bacterium]|nr:biopolymer transporter ExbD [Armatimonadota bacterium]